MSEHPEVSVIIPSYNHAEFVGTAIQSVLSQTVRDIEVIVVDDGSTDGSQKVIAAIKDPRIKFIPLKENRREHPRNLALSIAKGRYIAFQNSDDVWLPDKLERQMSFMERNEGTAVCFTGIELIGGDGRPVSGTWLDDAFTIKNRSRVEWLSHFFRNGNCLCISSALVRGSALGACGHFCPSLFYLSDFDLWVRLVGTGGLYIMEDMLTKLRVMAEKNLSRPDKLTERIRTLEYAEILSRFADPPIVNDVEKIFWLRFPSDGSLVSIYYGLVKHAWEVGSVFHMLFADRLLCRILEDEPLRKAALDLYGPKLILEFLENRKRIAITKIKYGENEH